ncbi:OmpA family protein [uncultured Hymenobacter sp.]|uniref:OmpA family protein n=1 Tax=uncultured Hymenobacter sp. TaxID=170016 RepID=UPI0035CC02FB
MRNQLVQWASTGVAALLLGGCAASGSLSKADKAFTRGEYEPAIALYKAEVAKGKNTPGANYRIAESYRLSNRVEQAEPFYKAALDGRVRAADAGFRYAEALRANGKFDEAAAQFSTYAQSGTNRTLAARAETEAKNAAASKALAASAGRYTVRPLESLNSAGADFSASLMPGTGELVFASGREGKKYLGNGENFNALYAIKFDDAKAMSGGTARRLEELFNQEGRHEASATYTPDGKTMVFARSNSGKKNDYKSADGSKTTLLSVDLWISYFRDNAWTVPVLANINDRSADDFAPAFAPDGTTLYFTSSRRSGLGGNDIYKATLGANGRFSPAENLGETVNTPGNDNFPGIAPDGTLYFSSDGRPGLGKLDLFQVKNRQVVNLGPEINSAGDDFAPFFTGPNTGLFASNRTGGKGSDDLYGFERQTRKSVLFALDGTVVEVLTTGDPTPRPLANQRVALTKDGQPVGEVTTDAAGKFTFSVDSASAYRTVAERSNYFTATQTVTIPAPPAQSQLTEDVSTIRVPVLLTLSPIKVNKAIVVENIFYDYNKANIRSDAAAELDKLVQTLVDNPKITIELSSHTDQRGKDAYNLSLSQRRANAAVAYIVSKGVDKSRLTAKGYGETRPVLKNAKTEPDYQRNRRTEFKVTRISE